MKPISSSPIRSVGVIKEVMTFSDYQKTVYNVWFDGNQVIDTLSLDDLIRLRDIMSEVISNQEGGQK